MVLGEESSFFETSSRATRARRVMALIGASLAVALIVGVVLINRDTATDDVNYFLRLTLVPQLTLLNLPFF